MKVRGRIQVIDRAAAIIDILARSDESTRLQVIAEQAGLVPSTTRRILLSLCEIGFCEQTSTGSYRLGMRLFELGRRVEATLDIRSVARAPLARLTELTDLTTFLCVRQADRAVAIERFGGRYAFSLALTVGGALPLHVGAAPRALLAWDPEPAIRSYLQRNEPIVKFTEHTLTDIEEIMADLRASRDRGWVLSEEDVTPGVTAMGMPVFGHASDQPVASIALAGLVPHVLGDEHERLLALLRETAEQISRRLGRDLHHRGDLAAGPGPIQTVRAGSAGWEIGAA